MEILTRWERLILLRILPLVVFVSAVVVGGLGVLVQSNSSNIDALDANVTELNKSTDAVEASTKRVERFVDDLETETPSEAAQNAAITAAVNQVPEIRAILCEQFPDATACEPG